MKEIFLQTLQVAFTEAGSLTKTVKLSEVYDRCKGIAVVSSKTHPGLQVSVSDNQKTYIQTCPVQLLESSTSVPMPDRFLPVLIQAQGKDIQLNFQVPAEFVGEKASFIFLLER